MLTARRLAKLGEVPTNSVAAQSIAYVIVKGLAEVGQHAEHVPVDHVHAAAAAGEPVARDVVDRAHQRLDVRAALALRMSSFRLVVLGQRMQELGSLCAHAQVRVQVPGGTCSRHLRSFPRRSTRA